MLGSSPVSASAARDAAARLLKPQDLWKQGPDHAPRTFCLDPRYPMVSIEQTLQAQLWHVTVMSEPKIAMEVAHNINYTSWYLFYDSIHILLYLFYIYHTFIHSSEMQPCWDSTYQVWSRNFRSGSGLDLQKYCTGNDGLLRRMMWWNNVHTPILAKASQDMYRNVEMSSERFTHDISWL